MSSASTHGVISVRSLSKRYGGVQALDSLDLDLGRNMVHAIVGENGAGKSTFMKILSGGVIADSGTIEINGVIYPQITVSLARELGIGIMYQELRLFQHRDVLTNLFPDREIRRGMFIARKEMEEIARPVLQAIGLKVDLYATLGDLAISDQQLIELARVMIEKPSLLILDEPTSALNARESERLLELVRQLPAQGTTVVYVSHRLDEVFAVANQISVMRNGSLVFSRPTTELDRLTVIARIVGEEKSERISRDSKHSNVAVGGVNLLQVESLKNFGQIRDISLTVRAGEIVGVAGLIGSGADELLETLFGAKPISSGVITLEGKIQDSPSTQNSVKEKVALVPADRKRVGLMMDRSVEDNFSHVAVGGHTNGTVLITKAGLTARAARLVERFDVKTENLDIRVGNLSGGNQQKVVIGKWLEINPRLVLLDDPTRGVDIGAKSELFRLVREMADSGKGVLFRSTEIAELTYLCDRTYVIKNGVTTREVSDVGEAELIKLINE